MKNIKVYKESFINQPQSFGYTKFRQFVKEVECFIDKPLASPTYDALSFYLDENILADMQRHYSDRATLPDHLQSLLKGMGEFQNIMFYRVFLYVLCIVHNEARHAFYESNFPVDELVNNEEDAFSLIDECSLFERLEDESTMEFAHYLYATHKNKKIVPNMSRNDLVISRISNDAIPDKVCLKDMLSRYHSLFCDFEWSYEFGGKTWGNLVKLLIDVSSGKITPKIFIDSAFSQEHNNGMIFDKEVIYSYTKIHSGKENISLEMQAILNAQNMGLIPQLILSDYRFGKNTKIHSIIQYIKDYYPSYMSMEMNEIGDNFMLMLEGE